MSKNMKLGGSQELFEDHLIRCGQEEEKIFKGGGGGVKKITRRFLQDGEKKRKCRGTNPKSHIITVSTKSCLSRLERKRGD